MLGRIRHWTVAGACALAIVGFSGVAFAEGAGGFEPAQVTVEQIIDFEQIASQLLVILGLALAAFASVAIALGVGFRLVSWLRPRGGQSL